MRGASSSWAHVVRLWGQCHYIKSVVHPVRSPPSVKGVCPDLAAEQNVYKFNSFEIIQKLLSDHNLETHLKRNKEKMGNRMETV